jgi:uncharacterized membrane protein
VIAPVHVMALLYKLNVTFPAGGSETEQIVLRWIHIVAGITWVGLLYFFNLVSMPVLKELDPSTRGRVMPPLMLKALWYFRWAAVVTWLAGFRYFMILAQTDADAAGNHSLMGRWLGIWFLCWFVAFAILMGLLQAGKGILNNGWVLGTLTAIVVIATGWIELSWIAVPGAGNRTLSISLGGGIATIMLLSVWGIVWRCQKRLIAWTRANAEHGTPMPPEAMKLARMAFLASRMNFWLSFPMLLFMAASAHYPFLSGQ